MSRPQDRPLTEARISENHPASTCRLRRRRLWIVACMLALFGMAWAGLARIRPAPARGAQAVREMELDAPAKVAALIRESREAVEALVDESPDSPDVLEVLARLHVRFGSVDEASCWCDRCLELDPKFAPAYLWKGTIAKGKGAHPEAARFFREARRLEPQSGLTAFNLAEVLMTLGESGEAVDVLDDYLRSDPQFAPALVLRGEIRLQQKEYREARRLLEEAIALAPDYANAHYALGNACAKLGDDESSKQHLERFRALRRKAEEDLRGDVEPAADTARYAAEILVAVARVRLFYERTDMAEDLLRRAIEIDPGQGEPRQVLGWLYERQGRDNDAIHMWEEYRRQYPDSLAAHVSLGAIYARLGRFDEAEDAYRTAIELTPYRPEPYAALVDVLLKANRKPLEAKVLALKAADLEPTAPCYFLLAAACLRSGDPEGAFSAVSQARSLDPGNERYRQMQETLQERIGR